MKLLITGATGFIGRNLVKHLLQQGQGTYEIIALSRDPESAKKTLPGIDIYEWDYNKPVPKQALTKTGDDKISAVIHLAGEPVFDKNWTSEQKTKILNSRTIGTENLIASLKENQVHPNVVLSASAIGYYGNRYNEVLDENSGSGFGFLSEVCQKWEKAAQKAEAISTRVVRLRIGFVVGLGGGGMQALWKVFKVGLGGPVGDGFFWLSWIHQDDLSRAIEYCILNNNLTGAVNAVAPNPVRNEEFTKALANALKKNAPFRVPKFLLKFIFGERSQLILDSARVLPKKLNELGFQFLFSNIENATKDLARKMDIKPKLIGLTGNIACGKSTVGNFLKEMGIPVIDADLLAREISERVEIKSKIADSFGTSDRKNLRTLVFENPEMRKKLENILHPLIIREAKKTAKSYFDSGHDLVIFEASLLVEGGFYKELDGLLIVTCLNETQMKNLLSRNQDINQELAGKMMSAQLSQDEKTKHADWVIENNSTFEALKDNTKKWLQKLKECI